MGYEMTKVLANSDVDYWRQMPAKESHQSAIFIGSAQGEKVRGLLGEAKTGDAVKIVLNRSNLIHVLTAHYEAKDQFFSSRNLGQWTITVEYLKQCLEQILAVFRTEEEVFIASVNRQTSAQNCRAWIKGLQPELKREDGTCGISIFDFLFSGDTLHFIRDDAWLVHIEIIPKVVTSVLGGSEKGLLRVGDVFSGKGNETYEVIGVEPHAYRIRFNKTGKIRTTPKTVVAAWYKFYKEHPFVDYDIEKKGTVEHKTNVPIREASSRALRDQYLNTSTEDDSFEHAYDGMLGNIARWLLDNPREEEEYPKNDAQLPTADVLTIALKMFAERRGTESPGGWNNYDEWTKGVRDEFSQVGESLLARPGFDYAVYLRKYSISWQVVNTKFAPHTSAEKHAVLKFLREQKESPKSVSWYIDGANRLEVGGNRVDGMSAKTLLYFMSELRPAEFAPWTEPTYEGLAFLGLHKGPAPRDLTVETYEDCKAKQHQIVARMKELGIGKASDDATDPDYRTVNEFLWWLGQNDNKDLIKEEVMSKAMKPADYSKSTNLPTAKKPKVNLANAEDVVLLRLAAALRAKPFAILAGHSGTGKSRMVRQLAYMTAAAGNHKVLFEDADGKPLKSPGNFCMVQVKPNWHDSTDLLGYYSELKDGFKGTDFVKFICKAYAYPDVPFFVCLDEMNLAPVEQYFAEYLSAIESRKIDDVVILAEDGTEKTRKSVVTDRLLADEVWRTKVGAQDFTGLGCEFTQSEHWLKKYGLTIPRNLFVVGTVNMDESTNQFSRKVLDRAFTLEMTDADFEHFGEKISEPSYSDFAGDDFAKALLDGEVMAKKPEAEAPRPEKDAFANQVKNLTSLQPVLDGTSFVVAYRFANEYMLYANALGKMCDVMDVRGDAAAASGEAKPVEAAAKRPEAFDDMILMKVLPRITGDTEMVMRIFAGDPGQDKEPRALDDSDVGGLAKLLGKESASFGKMKEIVKRGESSGSGTLTFWP